MTMGLLSHCDHGHVNLLKSLQRGFGRGTAGSPFGVACIQAGQAFVPIRQRLSGTELKQGQQTQANRELADQPSRSLVTLHIHRGERERFALESSKPPLRQIFFTVGQDGLLQSQPFLWVIGRIHAPAQAPHGCCHGKLIHLHVQAHSSLDSYRSRAVPIRTHCSFFHLFFDPQLEHPFDPVVFEDGMGGLALGADWNKAW